MRNRGGIVIVLALCAIYFCWSHHIAECMRGRSTREDKRARQRNREFRAAICELAQAVAAQEASA